MGEEDKVDFESMSKRKQRKHKYREKLIAALSEYKDILIISVDNVGSTQMQQVRIALRGQAIVLMGKNTIIRKVFRDHENTKLQSLLPFVRGNMGFVFCKGDLREIRKTITENKVPAAARPGLVAPADVFIPAGPSGLDPGQTSFFQALNIATKITKGAIEIINQVHLIKKEERVSASAVALLGKMNMKPFFFGIKVNQIYENGSIYSSNVLDFTERDLLDKFLSGVTRLACISMAINYPTAASLPHIVCRGFKNLLALSISTDYVFEESKKYKDLLDNPELLAAAQAAAAAASAPAAGGAAKVEAAPAKVESEEEEEAGGGDFDLFG
jgi:large subunit ribosomal protein LP0